MININNLISAILFPPFPIMQPMRSLGTVISQVFCCKLAPLVELFCKAVAAMAAIAVIKISISVYC